MTESGNRGFSEEGASSGQGNRILPGVRAGPGYSGISETRARENKMVCRTKRNPSALGAIKGGSYRSM